jgi:hypothetical protein
MNPDAILDRITGAAPLLRLGKNARDWAGHTHEALTVLRPYDRGADGHIRWLCECRCGKLVAVATNRLTRAKSCGCVTRWEGHEKVWPLPVKEHASSQPLPPMYEPIAYGQRNAMQLGDAGEHIVCADLLLAGWNAYQSAQGLPYDVVADISGRLIRIAVKSTAAAKPRFNRGTKARSCYRFNVQRPSRLSSGASVIKTYTAEHADMVALVALDIRRVAYVALSDCKRMMEVFSPYSEPGENRMGPKDGGRKRFELMTFDRALNQTTGYHDA